MTELIPDYSLTEVAKATGMSERWLRRKVSEGAEHLRYGHKIRFTAAQVEQLRTDHTRNNAQRVTTSRKRRAS